MGILAVVLLIGGTYVFGAITSRAEGLDDGKVGVQIASFIIPLVGFIVGAINLTKDDEEQRELGMNCIVLGIISLILSSIIYFSLF